MNINSIDLNLFLIFREVYATRNVTAAGGRLGLSQSAVSNALRRLRERFNDPLFVRTSSGMQPTPTAEQLIEYIEAGVESFSKAIDKSLRFDPATSTRLFRVALNDVGALVSVPHLFMALYRAGPEMVLETVNAFTAQQTRRLLLDGEVDLVLAGVEPMGEGFHQSLLFDEGVAIVLRKDHPLSADVVALEDYVSACHVVHPSSVRANELVHEALTRCGVDPNRKVALTSAHLMGLARILGMTNLLLTVPTRLAQALVEDHEGLRLARVPFEVNPLPIRLHWHDRSDGDEGHQWFRALTTEALRLPKL
jgi:DNA-binding transcriptional LysR family regulator